MGLLFIQAVQFADIPVMAAYLCLIGLIFVVINLVVDLLYYVVDPRLRIERAAAGGTGWSAALRRFFDSDVFYSFKRSPAVIVAAVTLLVCIVAAALRAVGRAAQPVRPEDAQPARRLHAARRGPRRGNPPLPARHRRPGARRALGDHLRLAHVAHHRAARHAARDGRRRRPGPHQRLRRRQDRRASSCAWPTCSCRSRRSSSRC